MTEASYAVPFAEEPANRASLSFVQKMISGLHPAYFALVMATGIVSIDCKLLGLNELAQILFYINIPAYAILCVLYLSRAALFTSSFVDDCFSHKRAFGFFTLVAGTNVLGSEIKLLTGNLPVAQALWCVALLAWLLCTYSIFVFLVIKREKPNFEEGINGGWLVAVVATQSMCVLGAQLFAAGFARTQLFGLFLLCFWLFGGMLYMWLISLIFYRYMFFKFEPSDLIPPYWINMGAMAISTLAGVELVISFSNVAPISEMMPFIKGVTLLYWATATWWIPMLLGLGIWRHGVRRFKFKYDPLYWGLVFPLGMYSVCTFKLAGTFGFAEVKFLSMAFVVLAVLAWSITFLSMAQRPVYASLVWTRVLLSRLRGG